MHAGGRPRTQSLPPDQMIELGKEMVEWVKKHNPLHLKQWYSMQKHIVRKQWRAMKDIPEFLPYYEEALSIVSLNYINGNINSSIAQRFLRIYFDDLKDQEDEDKREEIRIKNETLENLPIDLKQQFDALMKQISNVQQQRT